MNANDAANAAWAWYATLWASNYAPTATPEAIEELTRLFSHVAAVNHAMGQEVGRSAGELAEMKRRVRLKTTQIVADMMEAKN